ncbi:N-acetylglucosamine-6-phosphate deacetylase [bacterium]|nr:N-acetylglucosamine-6-phosphate deacetylase [bacterium]
MTFSNFIDLQINGYAGIDFNQDDLTQEDLLTACAALDRDQVQKVLVTIITDDISRMAARIGRIVQLRSSDPLIQRVVAGIHIEGPFISTVAGYVGAHPVAAATEATWDLAAPLLEAGEGLVKIFTLAPEQDPSQQLTRRLTNDGVIVSAGHTNATIEELDAAIDAGLSMFTHLGNGCPRLMDRHDNIIQRVLSRSDRLQIGLIADGAHVPFFTLRNYLKMIGTERAFVVSDAIAAAGCGPGVYALGDQQVTVGNDGVPRADDDSHLVGSATTMQQMAENLSTQMGLSDSDVLALTQENPLRILGQTSLA